MNFLHTLQLPPAVKQSVLNSIATMLGEQDASQRLVEIKATIQRMDTRWDRGFFTDEQTYFTQHLHLQKELERLSPPEQSNLAQRAASLLDNFAAHWDTCRDDVDSQHDLVKKIVRRVYVVGQEMTAITLHANCHLYLTQNANGPTAFTVDPFL